MTLEQYLMDQYMDEISNKEPKESFKNVFFRIYDRKTKNGEINFLKLGMDKDAFICLSTNQDHGMTKKDIASLCQKMKLTLKESEELIESAGYEKKEDAIKF